jgi:hypothetical protein
MRLQQQANQMCGLILFLRLGKGGKKKKKKKTDPARFERGPTIAPLWLARLGNNTQKEQKSGRSARPKKA